MVTHAVTAGQPIAVRDMRAVDTLCQTVDAMDIQAATGLGRNAVWGVELCLVVRQRLQNRKKGEKPRSRLSEDERSIEGRWFSKSDEEYCIKFARRNGGVQQLRFYPFHERIQWENLGNKTLGEEST